MGFNDHVLEGVGRVHNSEQVLGLRLLDIELPGEGNCSGDKLEVVLHFENGKELLIYRTDDGKVHVEGD